MSETMKLTGHKHPTVGEPRCPVTGTRYGHCWSDANRTAWPFNVCDQCAPAEAETAGNKLHALQERRVAAATPAPSPTGAANA